MHHRSVVHVSTTDSGVCNVSVTVNLNEITLFRRAVHASDET